MFLQVQLQTKIQRNLKKTGKTQDFPNLVQFQPDFIYFHITLNYIIHFAILKSYLDFGHDFPVYCIYCITSTVVCPWLAMICFPRPNRHGGHATAAFPFLYQAANLCTSLTKSQVSRAAVIYGGKRLIQSRLVPCILLLERPKTVKQGSQT